MDKVDVIAVEAALFHEKSAVDNDRGQLGGGVDKERVVAYFTQLGVERLGDVEIVAHNERREPYHHFVVNLYGGFVDFDREMSAADSRFRAGVIDIDCVFGGSLGRFDSSCACECFARGQCAVEGAAGRGCATTS